MAIEVDFQPIGRHVTVPSGTTVLEAAREAGIGISAVCGGAGSCGKCRIRLDAQAQVSKPGSAEVQTFDGSELADGMRLACQTEIYGPVRVEVPPESITATQRTEVEGEDNGETLRSPVAIHDLTLPKADLSDPAADFERIAAIVENSNTPSLHCRCLGVLKQIPELLRRNRWKIRAGIRGDELVFVAPRQTPVLGLAVDIGTTKVAGYLVDMTNGKTLAMKGIMNPQIAFGEDVMSRIAYCIKHDDGISTLQKAIVDSLNQLCRDLCTIAAEKAGAGGMTYAASQIVEAVMVGNTAMHHLLLGLPVKQLGEAPYVAAATSPLDIKAGEIGLTVSTGATVHMPANIAGFVGADHLAMLLATDTHQKKGVVVSLDIGTNTEITLMAHGRMTACSAASGPAFEGAHISHGMRAADGAIERVRITEGAWVYQTIGEAPPVGICGSGILDALAQLKLSGAMDRRGNLDAGHPLVRRGEKLPEVLLAAADTTAHGRDIVLNRSDINEIQLAKGAIRAGIELLLENAVVTAADIDEFIIAGAFGTYISVEAAVEIGMFPDIPLKRFRQVGNAAGIGAKQVLMSTTRRAEAAGIGERVESLELTANKKFQTEFMKAMYF